MKTRWKFPAIGVALAMFVLTQGGCATSQATKAVPESDEGMVKLSGKVVETADAGGYTYVLLEKDGKTTWAAVPTMKVTVGEQLDLVPGGEMSGFSSKTLGRTFDKIIFSGGTVQSVKEQAAKAKEAKATEAKSSEKKAAPAYEKPVLEGKVVETMNAGNYTYICLEKDGKKGWSAVPIVEVKVGEEIELLVGADMGQFTSTILKRTFDNIYFSGGIKGPDGQPRGRVEKAEAPAADPHAQAQAAPQQKLPPVDGKVVETMNAGGYSYVCLEKEGKKTWVAAPAMTVAIGDTLAFQPGMTMSNFTSKSLNRTFEKIIFTNGLAN